MNKKDYLEHFDKVFKTDTLNHINLDNMVLLKGIYRILEDYLCKTNKDYKSIRVKSSKLYDKLQTILSEEQKSIFNEFIDLNNEEMSSIQEQIFIFGYIIAKELDNESNIKLINE